MKIKSGGVYSAIEVDGIKNHRIEKLGQRQASQPHLLQRRAKAPKVGGVSWKGNLLLQRIPLFFRYREAVSQIVSHC
jgi:hypothetical protein